MPRVRGKKYPHVAICVDNGRAHGRGVLKGIADYVEVYGPWSIFLDPQAESQFPKGRSENWKGDGILTYIESAQRAERLRASGIPTVELFGFRDDRKLPLVSSDDHLIGAVAAEHLIERQFTRFAFTGYANCFWSQKRFKGFSRAIVAAGLRSPTVVEITRPETLPEWERVQTKFIEWLKVLQKPVGLLACSDQQALRVLDGCKRAGILVPDEVAVIGVDNNEDACRLSDPPLSSVMDNARRVGFEGARLLDRLMAGTIDVDEIKPVLIPPLGVVARRSTDYTAIEDRAIAEAVGFIREHACAGLNMKALPAKFGLSRSVFYRRFAKALERSPHEEILRLQIQRAKSLLEHTDLPLEKVAEMSGFQGAAYFCVVFKRRTSMSPGEYRRYLAQSA